MDRWFVDDTSAPGIIPSNSVSLLISTVSDNNNFSMVHNMKLNPTKYKEMLVNFLHNPKYLLRPVTIINNVINRVMSYKDVRRFCTVT